MIRDWTFRYGWLFAWLLVVATAYLVRSPLPIDETRYLGVAWEMWLRGDFLVPHINGEPYSHKPPLMFWLFHAGWALFGVNELWPRLVPPLFVLAGVFLTRKMAIRLWPDRPNIALLAPWILMGSFFWTLFTQAVMFDMLLMGMVLLSMLGLLRAAEGYMFSGWLLVGVATGLGILVKGPVMLLHMILPALLAPWWRGTARQHLLYWYIALVAATFLAAAIALAWALPAAESGGPAYGQAILWHQTADRMVSSFDHSRPFWWYLPLLPLMLAPWLIWPPIWRGFSALRPHRETGLRFLLSWMLPVFIAFTLISGKQPHYLIPLFPAFALLMARALDSRAIEIRRLDQVLPALFISVAGLLLLSIPHLTGDRLPATAQSMSPFWGIAVLLIGISLFLGNWSRVINAVVPLATAAILTVVVTNAGFFSAARPLYDVVPAAQFIAQLQEHGLPVAHLGGYHNQYQFLGRLKQPLQEINNSQLGSWRINHPDGYVVMYDRKAPNEKAAKPAFQQRYRGQWLSIWPAELAPDPMQ